MKCDFVKLGERILGILVFATAFSVLGYMIPRIYFATFDKTAYYFIKSPIAVEQKLYKPCDDVLVHLYRESLINTTAVGVKELVLVKSNEEVARGKDDLAITVGNTNIDVKWALPCNIDQGEYYFRGVVTYTVNGLEKSTTFETEKFTVTNFN